MPGKVNPVVPEAVTMVAAQVIGNDTTITIGGQSGNFELNVMLPVIADNLLDSLNIIGNVARVLADSCIQGFTVNEDVLARALQRNPILVTALNSVIGYDLGAATAKKAYAEGRSILDVALEMTDLDEDELKRLLDPDKLTRGGIQGLWFFACPDYKAARSHATATSGNRAASGVGRYPRDFQIAAAKRAHPGGGPRAAGRARR